MAEEKISNSQRLVNLTFALVAAGLTGLSKKNIAESVPGYGGKWASGKDAPIGKMVQRDLEWLRKSGVRVTFSPDDAEDSFKHIIERDTFNWPEGFHPNATQMRLLEIAANSWRDQLITEELQLGLTRLSALGEAPNREQLRDLLPSFRPMDETFQPLSSAINEGRGVVIQYRKLGSDEVQERTVSPWRFLNIEGEWLVQGWCHSANATRNFLLNRIVDKSLGKPAPVKVEKSFRAFEYHPASPKLIAEADKDLEEFRAKNVARLQIQPNSRAWAHFEMDFEGSDIKTLRYLDPELLAQTLRGYGDQLSVLEPESLKQQVQQGLSKVAAAHA